MSDASDRDPQMAADSTLERLACLDSAMFIAEVVMRMPELQRCLAAFKQRKGSTQEKVKRLQHVIEQMNLYLLAVVDRKLEQANLSNLRAYYERLFWPEQHLSNCHTVSRTLGTTIALSALLQKAAETHLELIRRLPDLEALAAELGAEWRMRCVQSRGTASPAPILDDQRLAVEHAPGASPRTVLVLGVPKTLPSHAAGELIGSLIEKSPLGLMLDDAKKVHKNASQLLNDLARNDDDWSCALDLPNGRRTGYRIRRYYEALRLQSTRPADPVAVVGDRPTAH